MLTRRGVQAGALAVLGALVPLIVLASLTLSKSEQAVRSEVGARLRLTTALSGALIAEQVGSIVSLVEGAAKRPRLVEALADGDPDTEDDGYFIKLGEALTLDGSQSRDPNELLGDAIVSFEWSLNGNALEASR